MNTAIRTKLEDAARAGTTLTYSDVAPLAGLDMSKPDHRNQMSAILCEIGEFEHAHGRPLLTAIVIRADLNHPGQGFYELAKQLGLFKGGDQISYFAQELSRVHSYWRASA